MPRPCVGWGRPLVGTSDVAGAWRVSRWAVQILQLVPGERWMAPDGLGDAALEGARDVHPVRGFEEDDLGSQGAVVEPAAGMVPPWLSTGADTAQAPVPTGKVSVLAGSMRLICQSPGFGATSTEVRAD